MKGPARAAVYLAAALVILGLAERGARVLVSRRLLVTAGADWIWASGALDRDEGLAFYAVRDLELGSPPDRAQVHLLADEAYILYVNGRRVGSGAYYTGAPLDTYPLDRTLRPGWNRIVVELRSARGAGGLLLALFAEGERAPLAVSGSDWRIFHDATALIEGTRPFSDGEPALVWQSPPTARWGIPRFGPERPTFDTVVAAQPGPVDPPLVEPRTDLAAPTAGDPPLIADFGRPVTGYLLIGGLAGGPRRLRIEVGLEPAKGEGIDLLLADGQTQWSTTEAHTLRYVGSNYLPDTATLALVPVDPGFAARDAARAASRLEGVFGVEPPLHDPRLDVGF